MNFLQKKIFFYKIWEIIQHGGIAMATKKVVKKAVKPVLKKKGKPVLKKKAKAVAKKAERYTCGVCGLVVAVNRDCGCAHVHKLVCCGKVMKKK
jgi:hypothetical protein